MMILPQLPLYAIAIICGLLSFFVIILTMPRIIRKLEAADIVGKDIHKSWKPVVAEMGGFGILFKRKVLPAVSCGPAINLGGTIKCGAIVPDNNTYRIVNRIQPHQHACGLKWN